MTTLIQRLALVAGLGIAGIVGTGCDNIEIKVLGTKKNLPADAFDQCKRVGYHTETRYQLHVKTIAGLSIWPTRIRKIEEDHFCGYAGFIWAPYLADEITERREILPHGSKKLPLYEQE